ncbi:uncharacterized protein LOC121003547 isoform X2 [Bufo bufo]|uniref:uncharacterized protein LOC121003547 isoform X2 n=1 Tax=Bufo bufo TaxID=8384 RepID=UPI001ABE57C7|nr:uncharacterized protein LOC121003547 isoform X2 [Bufo bufo]
MDPGGINLKGKEENVANQHRPTKDNCIGISEKRLVSSDFEIDGRGFTRDEEHANIQDIPSSNHRKKKSLYHIKQVRTSSSETVTQNKSRRRGVKHQTAHI